MNLAPMAARLPARSDELPDSLACEERRRPPTRAAVCLDAVASSPAARRAVLEDRAPSTDDADVVEHLESGQDVDNGAQGPRDEHRRGARPRPPDPPPPGGRARGARRGAAPGPAPPGPGVRPAPPPR